MLTCVLVLQEKDKLSNNTQFPNFTDHEILYSQSTLRTNHTQGRNGLKGYSEVKNLSNLVTKNP